MMDGSLLCKKEAPVRRERSSVKRRGPLQGTVSLCAGTSRLCKRKVLVAIEGPSVQDGGPSAQIRDLSSDVAPLAARSRVFGHPMDLSLDLEDPLADIGGPVCDTAGSLVDKEGPLPDAVGPD